MIVADFFWIAVQVKRTSFRKAEAGLLRQKFIVFAPKLRQEVSRFGKKRTESALLFPGYLFVAIDLADPKWRAVSNTPGVARIITRKAGDPAKIPLEFLQSLMKRCDSTGHLKPPTDLKAGDKVRIASGPFSTFIATVERIDEKRRVWVLLEMLGSTREVGIEMANLQNETTQF